MSQAQNAGFAFWERSTLVQFATQATEIMRAICEIADNNNPASVMHDDPRKALEQIEAIALGLPLRGATALSYAQGQRCPSRSTTVAKDALKLSEDMIDRNSALRLYVSDLTAVMLRMVASIDHLSEIARQWEPDHSSGADRRGWVLAKDARDDALRLLQEHSQRIGA